MPILEWYRWRKTAKGRLQQGYYLLNMRGDLMDDAGRASLVAALAELRAACRGRRTDAIREAADRLSSTVDALPSSVRRRPSAWCEQVEMVVVAVAAAMALRAYFIQPFKIPTGSMQPTLYGITAHSDDTPGFMDRMPLKLVTFAVTGTWYSERRATADGALGDPRPSPTDPSAMIFTIGGKPHVLPKDALYGDHGEPNPAFHPARRVRRGDLLWSGVTRRGDHLFVNKVIWNFRKPRRDEVMVFSTDGIPTLEPGTHYIKRMCGLPGERIAIHPPHLMVDNQPVSGFRGIDRVTAANEGYDGYQLAGVLNSERLEWPMREGEYFALGDNTGNSRDSRYWGPVPAENLVGPASFVYWPFTPRWGRIR